MVSALSKNLMTKFCFSAVFIFSTSAFAAAEGESDVVAEASPTKAILVSAKSDDQGFSKAELKSEIKTAKPKAPTKTKTDGNAKNVSKETKKSKDLYPGLGGKMIDLADEPDADLDANSKEVDDFQRLKTKMKQDALRHAKGPSEDEIVEKELEKLRLVEEKTESERARVEKDQARIEREEAKNRLRQRQLRIKEYRDQARQEASGLPGISRDESRWRGLED